MSLFEKMRENSSKPSFIKYLTRGEDWKSKSMRYIPKEFEKSKPEGFDEKRVVISVLWGNSWQLWLRRDIKGLFMIEKDWNGFVDDNLLGQNHILLFTHEDTMFLRVQFFKEDGTEIILPPHERATDPKPDPETDHESEAELLHPSPQDTRQKKTLDPATGSRARQGSILVKDRDQYIRYLKNPNNPFFVKIIPKKNDVLYVSRPLIKDYNLRFGEKIEYLLPHGKEEGITKYHNGHACFNGWTGLVRRYNLKYEDIVVCELEHTNGLVTAVRVHFVDK